MKKWELAVVMLAVQVLFSCSEKEMDESNISNAQIVAYIDNPDVTSAVAGNDVGGTNAVGIVWTDSDEIGVFDESKISQKRYTKVNQGIQVTATFAASDAKAFDGPAYAYYPYNEANSSKAINALTGTLPAIQQMDGVKLHGDYKYGRVNKTTADGDYEFIFKRLFSLARITIDATGTPLEEETMKSLTVSVNRGDMGVPIAGDFTFSAEDGSWTQIGEGANSITFVWEKDAPALNQPQMCYMSLFPLVESGDIFTVTVLTENYKAEFTANSMIDFNAEQIYNFPVVIDKYETDNVIGRFTCAALNVDGLPFFNSDGPGSEGTKAIGNAINSLNYDFIAVSEDFGYHNELVEAMTNYDAGTYRGSVSSLTWNDTDGLEFFWRRDDIKTDGETIVPFEAAHGGLTGGANTLIAKGFRHYEVTMNTEVTVDVYITHMNTYSGGNNTEDNEYVKAQLSQLRQMRDYVVANAKANNRPAIIMGDTNMRYTRHQIVANLINPVTKEGLQISDPWVEFYRGGVYPEWNTSSLIIRSKFGGGSDILCADDQRGEVVDKMWYINVPEASLQLEAVSCMNEVENFVSSTEQVSYSGVTVEDENGRILYNQSVNYTKINGYADHFPVVVTFKYTLYK